MPYQRCQIPRLCLTLHQMKNNQRYKAKAENAGNLRDEN